MYRNNPSEGKKLIIFFSGKRQFFFSQHYFHTSGYFMSFCCPCVPLQAFSYIPYKLATYSSSPNSQKKDFKKQAKQNSEGLCSGIHTQHMAVSTTQLTRGLLSKEKQHLMYKGLQKYRTLCQLPRAHSWKMSNKGKQESNRKPQFLRFIRCLLDSGTI